MLRTDMARDFSSNFADIKGVEEINYTDKNGCEVSEITVKTVFAQNELGLPMGKYFTIEAGRVTSLLASQRQAVSKSVAEALKGLLGKNEKVLVIGLGNIDITPDSLGPKTAKKVFVTRHILKHIPEAIDERSAEVCAVSPGVLGVTGIESFEIISSLVKRLKPGAIIIVDAYCAMDTDRIGSSFQLSDAGIQPGAGMGNHRQIISEDTLGVKVIAVGVPTVVYASTIAKEYIREAGNVTEEQADELCDSIENRKNELIITPTDIDKLTDVLSKIIADAINLAVNEHISAEDIMEFMG